MRSSTDAVLAPDTEKQLIHELTELCAEFAPRRLALCALAPDLDDAIVIGWGMVFHDEVVVYLSGPHDGRPIFATFSSLETAMARLTRHDNVRIVWIDPEPVSGKEL